ncbi:MAG TPA: hypothetical protein VGF48_21515 [Thermoanaerobaculia bacterium]|jgi:drug/metabolite transporter (DMT)-like permease
MSNTFYAIVFLAGFVDICPPNWPFPRRWPIPPPPPPWRFLTDILGGVAGVAGGVVTQRLAGGGNSGVLLTAVAVAVLSGAAVRQVAGYFGKPTPQPAIETLKAPSLA